MKYLFSFIFALAFVGSASAQSEPVKYAKAPSIHELKGVLVPAFDPEHLQFPRGMTPTPRHKLMAAPRFKSPYVSLPAQVIALPKQLSYWGNNQYGNCVSAQEAAAKAFYSTYCGLPETFISEANVIAWARKHGFLNGANLDEVMNVMRTQGMTATDNKIYNDGPYVAVDYSSEPDLQAAIVLSAAVNVGLDANALPSGAGNAPAWYAFGGTPGHFRNEDHCVLIGGYGSTALLFQKLGEVYGKVVSPPAGAPANGYLLFTWNTVGVVDHKWIMSTVGETWVRNPTTPGQSPQPIPPDPGPGPTPTPNPTPIPIPSPGIGEMIIKIKGQPDIIYELSLPGSKARQDRLEAAIMEYLKANPRMLLPEKPAPTPMPDKKPELPESKAKPKILEGEVRSGQVREVVVSTEVEETQYERYQRVLRNLAARESKP